MAVPSSGSVSLAGIGAEVKLGGYDDTATAGTSLTTLATTTTINTNSASVPNASAPHAMSEWRGYNHSAAAAFTNNNAVSKSLTTGEDNSITFLDTDDTFNIAGTDTWSISLWIKAGWSSSLNTSITFLIIQKGNASFQNEDMVKLQYAENTNRIELRYGNKPSSSVSWFNQAGWLFHSNSGSFASGFSAAGLGTTFWSSSNRGNVNSDDYTMITITNDGTNTASSLRLYWNDGAVGTGHVLTNNNSGNRSSNPISSTNNRQVSIGANGIHSGQEGNGQQRKTGNNSATIYNDLTIWNKKLSDSEVSELYNEGEVLNAQTHSASSDLIGYWKFESDGSATVSNDDFTISGDSSIVEK